jgi:hypothetical protein
MPVGLSRARGNPGADTPGSPWRHDGQYNRCSMTDSLTKFERRAIHLSVVVFMFSMVLPAYRPMRYGSFMPGYEIAWMVELFFWSMSWDAS